MRTELKHMLFSVIFGVLVFQFLNACNQQGEVKRDKPAASQFVPGQQPYPYMPVDPYYNPNQYPGMPPANRDLSNRSNGTLDAGSSTNPNTLQLPATCTMDPVTYKNIDPDIFAIEKAIWQMTNAYRKKTPFEFSERMSCIARDWSRQQAGFNRISHRGFSRERVALYQKLFPGWTVEMFAENVAYVYGRSNRLGGYDVHATAKELTDNWWSSWGHRINMQSNNRYIGVGVWKNGSRFYGTQIFGSEHQ